jgi:hypothetical protein
MPKHRKGLLIEAVDEGVLGGANVGTERLGGIDQDFICIGAR